jgi:hypothetical protein
LTLADAQAQYDRDVVALIAAKQEVERAAIKARKSARAIHAAKLAALENRP